ncbi:hypothetical protein D3C71_1957550 [compost metagenome]
MVVSGGRGDLAKLQRSIDLCVDRGLTLSFHASRQRLLGIGGTGQQGFVISTRNEGRQIWSLFSVRGLLQLVGRSHNFGFGGSVGQTEQRQ